MPILSHGSDLRLAPTIRPFVEARGAARAALTTVSEHGFSTIQLDATLPGMRPRELDASARRDLVSTAARCGLSIAGIDFFIPADHYADPAHLDRAAEAAIAGCSLAGDLGRVPLSLNLPTQQADASLVQELITAAEGCGIRLAVHDEANHERLTPWLGGFSGSAVGAGLDPASLLGSRADPVSVAQALGSRLAVARLSDAQHGQADGSRLAAGRGSLDLLAYRAAVDLAPSRTGPVVLDLRMVNEPMAAAKQAAAAWERAALKL